MLWKFYSTSSLLPEPHGSSSANVVTAGAAAVPAHTESKNPERITISANESKNPETTAFSAKKNHYKTEKVDVEV